MLNLCQADSKAQHQNPIKNNHYSIAVDKSNTTETADRVYANLGKPFLRDMILTFSETGESCDRTDLIM